jgi:hypothetical protein
LVRPLVAEELGASVAVCKAIVEVSEGKENTEFVGEKVDDKEASGSALEVRPNKFVELKALGVLDDIWNLSTGYQSNM